ncbi:MAG: hypothetical protein JNJ88_09170 [Planctomycetes bacterium]|nr:hypothetical protein [Planctomycetota bacterium]
MFTRLRLLTPLTFALLAAPALATNSNPLSGTPINLKVGESFPVKLTNAAGCTFDFSASAIDATIAAPSRLFGTNLKGATISITGKSVGTTMVTIQSMNGTCPPATHTFPVTVAANPAAIPKQYSTLVKAQLNTFKIGAKLEYGLFNSALKDLAGDYVAGQITDNGLHDGFHEAADTLRRGLYSRGWDAHEDVIIGGTQMLVANALNFGEGPLTLFAGGCGSFDQFQDSICGEFAKFHTIFDKASKNGIKAFEKAGAPRMGQWCTLPPLFSNGAFYPAQVSQIQMPQPLLGPLTITTLPSDANDNGRLRVSGMASTMSPTPFQVILTRDEMGQPTFTETQNPVLNTQDWTATFSNLKVGTYFVQTKYEGDYYSVRVPIQINLRF